MADMAAKNPPNAETDTLLSLYYSRNLLHAEKSCRELLARYPESALVFNILGMVSDAQGKDLQAIKNYKKATQLKPDYADAFNNIGILLNRLGRPKEAVARFEEAVRADSDFADACNNLGVMLQNPGQHEKALEHLSKAIKFKSTCPATHFNYAKSLRAQGKLEQALNIYNEAIDLKPDYFEAYNNRGNRLEDLQRDEEARKSYTSSIRLKSDYALAYSNRGRVQKKIGNYTGAMEDFFKAIEFGSWRDNASDQNLKSRLYANLGDILMFFRQYARAWAAYDEALKIEPDNQNLIGMKGNAIAALGEIEEGLKLKQQGYGAISYDNLKGVSFNHGQI